jgi:hypothetical protein
MQMAIRIIIILIALFFAVGAVFAYRGTLDNNTYIAITGVVGSIASIIGLIALAGSKLTAKDVRNVEAELFQTLADQVKLAQENEEKLAANRQELTRLERERVEIELLVRQASLKVYMEERLRNIAHDVEKRLSSDLSLAELCTNYQETLGRVKQLNGEISKSPRADLIEEIIQSIPLPERMHRPKMNLKFFGIEIDLYPFIAASTRVTETLMRSLTGGKT